MELKYKREPMRVLPLDERWFHGVSPKARKHLVSSLKSLEAGRAPTPSFKLYGKSDVSLVDDFFKKVKVSGLQIPEWQLKYEMSRKEKWGPQGGYAPWAELKDAFELYYSRPSSMKAHPKVNTLEKYSRMNLRVDNLSTTLQHLKDDDKILDRAAGWRSFDLKKTDPAAQAIALADARSGNWMNGWFYTFSRYNKLKKRIFFPGPFSFMIVEAQYYYPFLKYIQESLKNEKANSPFTFWADKIGFDRMFDEIVTPKCASADPKHLVFIQRDFEKMDTTVGEEQTLFSFYPRLKRAFGFSPQQEKLRKDIIHFGATSPVATPSGMYTGYRGKASGANTTNGDETCCNEDYDDVFLQLLQKYCKTANIKFNVLYTGGNGDDGIGIFELADLRRLSTFKKLIAKSAEEAAEIFEFRVQGSKWHISTEYGLYCQRMVASRDGKIWNGYPATLILNAIVNPEKEYNKASWDKDYRDLDIIEKLDNGKNLQYFHELIDFVDNGMKYRLLGKSEEETRRILSKYERYRALRDEPFNWQDPETGKDITKSPTLRYLLEKRHIRL